MLPTSGYIQDPELLAIQDRYVVVDGSRMRFLRSGSGPSLVLLHGLLGYSFSWRHAIPVFAQTRTVHAVDMLGAGLSDRPQQLDCSLRGCAGRLLQFLDAVGIRSCDLMGTSHGGAVAMMAAALAPDRVQRLILVAPVNPWSQHGRHLAALMRDRAISTAFLRLAPLMRMAHGHVLRRLYCDQGRIRSGTLEGYSGPLALPGALEYGVKIALTWDQDLRELKSCLPDIREVPTLLVWGDKDRAVSPASASDLRKNFSRCYLAMFRDVGHLPYEEAPEEFNRVVSEFLQVQIGD